MKITILSKAIDRFNEIPVKIPTTFFTERKTHTKIWMQTQKIAKRILNKKKPGRVAIPDFKMHFMILLQSYTNKKPHGIGTKETQTCRWNKTENSNE